MSESSDTDDTKARVVDNLERKHPDGFPIDTDRMLADILDDLSFAAKMALTAFFNTGGNSMDEVDIMIVISDGTISSGSGHCGVPVDLEKYRREG